MNNLFILVNGIIITLLLSKIGFSLTKSVISKELGLFVGIILTIFTLYVNYIINTKKKEIK
jgi:hypothetical protein